MASELNLSVLASRLKDVRMGLLKLHKALLEYEKANYEARNGRIKTTGEYYNLVVNDPWFDWLRTMSKLIVEIDEAFDAKVDPLTEEAVIALASQTNKLVSSNEETEFGQKYQAALQNSPDAMFEHILVVKSLGKFNNEV